MKRVLHVFVTFGAFYKTGEFSDFVRRAACWVGIYS